MGLDILGPQSYITYGFRHSLHCFLPSVPKGDIGMEG